MAEEWLTGKEINEKFMKSKRWIWTTQKRKGVNIRIKQQKTGTAYNGTKTLFKVSDVKDYLERRQRWQKT